MPSPLAPYRAPSPPTPQKAPSRAWSRALQHACALALSYVAALVLVIGFLVLLRTFAAVMELGDALL